MRKHHRQGRKPRPPPDAGYITTRPRPTTSPPPPPNTSAHPTISDATQNTRTREATNPDRHRQQPPKNGAPSQSGKSHSRSRQEEPKNTNSATRRLNSTTPKAAGPASTAPRTPKRKQRTDLLPSIVDQNLWAQSRIPMDMRRHGWLRSLFQASQQ